MSHLERASLLKANVVYSHRGDASDVVQPPLKTSAQKISIGYHAGCIERKERGWLILGIIYGPNFMPILKSNVGLATEPVHSRLAEPLSIGQAHSCQKWILKGAILRSRGAVSVRSGSIRRCGAILRLRTKLTLNRIKSSTPSNTTNGSSRRHESCL